MTDYDEHDVDVRERLARVEEKIDYMNENLDSYLSKCTQCRKDLDGCQTELSMMRANRNLVWKFVVPVCSILSAAVSSFVTRLLEGK